MYRTIPTYDNGVWLETEYETIEDFREFIDSIFLELFRMISAPAFANSIAIAFPIPLELPVIKATLFLRFNVNIMFL